MIPDYIIERAKSKEPFFVSLRIGIILTISLFSSMECL
jgi:hypothetical protein